MSSDVTPGMQPAPNFIKQKIKIINFDLIDNHLKVNIKMGKQ